MSYIRYLVIPAALTAFSIAAHAEIPVSNVPLNPMPPPPVVTIVKASQTINATRGAADAVLRKASTIPGEDMPPNSVSRGTHAGFHAEGPGIIADVDVSRFVPAVGDPITFLNYNVINLADDSKSASGGLEVPDPSFTGDPRKDGTVRLILDLSGMQNQVQGTPLIIDATWTKTDEVESDVRSNGSTKIRTENSVTRTSFKSTFDSTSANVTVDSNIIPMQEARGSISWDDFRTFPSTSPQ